VKHPDEILLIGTGNLAAHLAAVLSGPAGYRLDVAGREQSKTEAFCNAFGGLPYLEEEGKFYQAAIVCVSDEAIATCASKYGNKAEVLIHTSGASPLEVIKELHAETGVFWPVQTFSRGREIDWKNLPVCIQSNGQKAEQFIRNLAERTGIHPVESTSEERLKYHLAAVLVCNFVNHLYTVADIWCRENLLNPDFLKPLILETAKKVQELNPPESQTGPAKRGDTGSMEKHLALLNDHPAIRQVYTLMSEQIQNRYQYLRKP